MAQNALTVTTPNPTPPTNLSFAGSTPPDPATWDPTVTVIPTRPDLAPYFDDGVTNALYGQSFNEPSLSRIVFAANHAALPVGGTSVPAEGAGTETLFTAAVPNPSPAGQLQMVGCGPAATPASILAGPNASHASYLLGSTAATITSLSAGGVHGPGTTLLTVTGTGFTRASVVQVNGVNQTTNYASPTSISVTNAPKAGAAGNVPVTVSTGGSVTAPTNWVFT